MIPIFLSIFLIYLFIKYRKTDNKLLKNYFFLYLIVLFLALPLVLDHLYNPQTLSNRFKMISIENQSNNLILLYINNYFSYFTPSTLFLSGETNPNRTIPGFGYENPILGVFYYFGLFYLFFRKKNLKLIFPKLNDLNIFLVKIFIVLFPLIPSLTLPSGDFQRASHYLPIMIIISAIGMFIFINFINKFLKTSRILIYSIFSCVIFFYLFNEIIFIKSYFGEKYSTLTKWYFQNGLDKVVENIQLTKGKYDKVIIDSTINQPYIYLLFYGKTDPRSFTQNDYSSFNTIDKKTNWLAVSRFRNFSFRHFTLEETAGAKLTKTIPNTSFSRYVFYEKDNILFVRFETDFQ